MKVVFAMAFVGGVASACSPGVVHWLLAVDGASLYRVSTGAGDRSSAIGAEERSAAYLEHLVRNPQGFTGVFTRARGKCGIAEFSSAFEVRGMDNGQIRLYQAFDHAFEQFSIKRDVWPGGASWGGGKPGGHRMHVRLGKSGGFDKQGAVWADGSPESRQRSGPLVIYTDQSRQYDEIYMILPKRDIGIVTNGTNRSIRLLRDLDALAALDRRWLTQVIEKAHQTGKVPSAFGAVLGAPNQACTMLLALTPDEDNVPFERPDRQKQHTGIVDIIQGWKRVFLDHPGPRPEQLGADSTGSSD